MGKHVYISGALTGLSPEDASKLKAFYERIGKICEGLHFDPYVPHLHSDPIAHAHFTPSQVDEIDRREVAKADLIIAYVGVPSTGTGIEVEIAHHAGRPVVLMFEKDRAVSRLVRGNPAIIYEIAFTDFGNAFEMLVAFLLELTIKEQLRLNASVST